MSTWVKVYNSLPSHPKIIEAGDRAAWLFVCGLCYCNEHLTDGRIDAAMLPIVAPGMKSAGKLAAALVKVGLWEMTPGGWQVHEYGEFQRSASEVKEQRRKAAERKRLSRSGHSGVTA